MDLTQVTIIIQGLTDAQNTTIKQAQNQIDQANEVLSIIATAQQILSNTFAPQFTDITNLTGQVATLTASLAQAQSDLAAANATIATLQAQIVSLTPVPVAPVDNLTPDAPTN